MSGSLTPVPDPKYRAQLHRWIFVVKDTAWSNSAVELLLLLQINNSLSWRWCGPSGSDLNLKKLCRRIHVSQLRKIRPTVLRAVNCSRSETHLHGRCCSEVWRPRAATGWLKSGPQIYQSIGVEPVINCRGTFTIIGASIELPEVRAAMDAAAQHYVQLDELAEAVGRRLAELTGAEWGMVSAGCAAGLKHVTAACVAGATRKS